MTQIDRDRRWGNFPRERATNSRPANGVRRIDLGAVATPQMMGYSTVTKRYQATLAVFDFCQKASGRS